MLRFLSITIKNDFYRYSLITINVTFYINNGKILDNKEQKMKIFIFVISIVNLLLAEFHLYDTLNVVYDDKTNLTWSYYASNGSYYTAYDTCNNLDLADKQDWRLPTYHELTSIVNISGINPAIDTTYFHIGSEKTHYTSDHCAGYDNNDFYWSINFYDGKSGCRQNGDSAAFRCVRDGNITGHSIEYSMGYADGNTTGWHDGNLSGYYDGNVSGYNYGYTDGNITGFNLGYADGNLSGYTDGNTSGYLLGHTDGNITGTVYCENNPSEFSLVTLLTYQQGVYDANNTGWHDGNLSGFADGNLSGYTDGNLSGYIDGNTSGYNSGQSDGYASGYYEGNTTGWNDGNTTGYADGNTSGFSLGFTDGNNSGYNQGHTIGYNAGDSDGYDRGYPIGFTDGNDTGYGLGRSDAIDDCKAHPEGCGIKPKAVIVPMF